MCIGAFCAYSIWKIRRLYSIPILFLVGEGFAASSRGRATQALRHLAHCANPFYLPLSQPPVYSLCEEHKAAEIQLSQLPSIQVWRLKIIVRNWRGFLFLVYIGIKVVCQKCIYVCLSVRACVCVCVSCQFFVARYLERSCNDRSEILHCYLYIFS